MSTNIKNLLKSICCGTLQVCAGVTLVTALSACAPTAPQSIEKPATRVTLSRAPDGTLQDGVKQYVWEEPMTNVVEVPPGLDPEGIYYRPAHKEVVEIRQGRWQYFDEGSVK